MPKVLSRGENMPDILPRGKICQAYSQGGVYAKTTFQGGNMPKILSTGEIMSNIIREGNYAKKLHGGDYAMI